MDSWFPDKAVVRGLEFGFKAGNTGSRLRKKARWFVDDQERSFFVEDRIAFHGFVRF